MNPFKFLGALALGGGLAACLAVSASAQDNVPREATLVIGGIADGNEFRGVGIANPFMAGNDIRHGVHNLFEPLFYYNSFEDELTPWLATGYEFNDAFTELTLSIRDGVTWADGVPFTAEDVAFTFEMLRLDGEAGGGLAFGAELSGIVASATATDASTVTFELQSPNPRFVLSYLSSYFDRGVIIVPKHVFEEAESPADFTFYDEAMGYPFGTSPFELVRWTPGQIMLDRREGWWAAEIGFHDMPQVERILVVPHGNADRAAQLLITNQLDTSMGLPVPVMRQVIERNPAVVTHTGQVAPYGYQDAWPTSMWFNTTTAPFDNPQVRQAMSLLINREQVIEVAHEGASAIAISPLPDFGSMAPFVAEITDIIAESRTADYDPEAAYAMLADAGLERDDEGFWLHEGARISFDMHMVNVLLPIGNVVAEQLRQGGFEARAVANNDSRRLMSTGESPVMIFGHLGGVADPYPTLDLYHGRWAVPTGTAASSITRISRMSNPAYDAIVDQIALLAPDDPAMRPLFVEAMEIWYDERPDAPISHWYHRIPMSTTYWTNWPNEENAYMQGASFFRSFSLVLYNLERAG